MSKIILAWYFIYFCFNCLGFIKIISSFWKPYIREENVYSNYLCLKKMNTGKVYEYLYFSWSLIILLMGFAIPFLGMGTKGKGRSPFPLVLPWFNWSVLQEGIQFVPPFPSWSTTSTFYCLSNQFCDFWPHNLIGMRQTGPAQSHLSYVPIRATITICVLERNYITW